MLSHGHVVVRFLRLCLILLLFNVLPIAAQQSASAPGMRKPVPAQGRSMYNSSCAGCHGLDGKGSDKAANIAGSPRVRQASDSELSAIISNGIPESGMPSFRNLSERQLRGIVGYLRSLQGNPRAPAVHGDASRGKEIFFGRGDCSSCHTISGEGGFLGPDLTDYAASASADVVRDEIVKAPRVPSHGYRAAVLTTANGERVEGLVRNEDNFSVQMQTKDGSFHFFKKAELRSFERMDSSLMPSDYRQRLSDRELDDLVSYLMKTPDPKRAATQRKNKDDFE
jgi:cytochrome c oxidase cbb3-type subunit III